MAVDTSRACAPQLSLAAKQGQCLNVRTKAATDLICCSVSFFPNAGIWPRPCVIELIMRCSSALLCQSGSVKSCAPAISPSAVWPRPSVPWHLAQYCLKVDFISLAFLARTGGRFFFDWVCPMRIISSRQHPDNKTRQITNPSCMRRVLVTDS
jgi:hypothetical protein